MRVVETARFGRDVKRLKKKRFNLERLYEAVKCVASRDGDRLRTKYKDHALKGALSGYRELHIDGDWLLVYAIKEDEMVLLLVRTGSHDEVL